MFSRKPDRSLVILTTSAARNSFWCPQGSVTLPPEEDKQICKFIYSFGHQVLKCCWQLNERRPGIVNLRALMCIFTHYLSISSCYLMLAAVAHANLRYWKSGCCVCCCCCCFYVTWGCKLNCPAGINKVVWLIDYLKNAQLRKCLSSKKLYTRCLWQIGPICPGDVDAYLHI